MGFLDYAFWFSALAAYYVCLQVSWGIRLWTLKLLCLWCILANLLIFVCWRFGWQFSVADWTAGQSLILIALSIHLMAKFMPRYTFTLLILCVPLALIMVWVLLSHNPLSLGFAEGLFRTACSISAIALMAGVTLLILGLVLKIYKK